MHYKKIESPIGVLYLVASAAGLRRMCETKQEAEEMLRAQPAISPADEKRAEAILDEAEKQLKEYFARTRTAFDLPLDAQGTAFQKRVWKRLSRIPYGQTRSYGRIAAELGDAKAARAVGAANGKNPLCVIVPCHRVLAAHGGIGGYSFRGGIEIKKLLLALENPARADEAFGHAPPPKHPQDINNILKTT